MDTHDKCARCHRRCSCALHDLAVLTHPWVEEALASSGSDWDRANCVRRALRGGGCSPGFVEDWLFEGAITHEDVTLLIEDLLRKGRADLSQLTRSCRHYVGPVIQGDRPLAAA